ncbi:MAG: DNA-binding protein [Armatimonadota bacterium]|nr:MAG: DNA-binding protein [Armatimonadota bacterium]
MAMADEHHNLSSSVQDYLKAIHRLQEKGARATTQKLAAALGTSAAAASKMVRHLSDRGLVSLRPYHGFILTESGSTAALQILRHHRLIETWLCRAMGFSWDEVHEEAERLEHHISERLEERIAALLGDPMFDPHGHPIPSRDGSVRSRLGKPLAACADGESAVVQYVDDSCPALLRRLEQAGIFPGGQVRILRGGADGPITMQTPAGAVDLTLAEAGLIFAESGCGGEKK